VYPIPILILASSDSSKNKLQELRKLFRLPFVLPRREARYGGILSQDIGPWSNIEPDECSATVAKMRWILRIQTQEGAAER
jgi:hypothetical protein